MHFGKKHHQSHRFGLKYSSNSLYGNKVIKPSAIYDKFCTNY